ncbi:hypothetical protein GCM10017581_039280 [Dactylosporangium matsuzakiense]|uniref:Uncharacterized protein n=1 Tax=Dactylosporangium matsuzakiense TaxID=53360 RepID=A0A9W6NMG6_9ACTN|nr:hypothetical protein GCM10017581_039280 [Dactylosporangium matsuzakiense]
MAALNDVRASDLDDVIRTRQPDLAEWPPASVAGQTSGRLLRRARVGRDGHALAVLGVGVEQRPDPLFGRWSREGVAAAGAGKV